MGNVNTLLFCPMNQLKILITLLPKITGLKLLNIIKLFSSYYTSVLFKRSIHKGLPYFLTIEPINQCNLHCSECPTGQNTLARSKGKITFDLYKKIIDENYKNLIYLQLYFQGEPFLHPDFIAFVRYAVEKNIYTVTSTNAHFLDDETCEQIIQSGLDKLIISLDGLDQPIYSSYRIGGNIDQVKEGVERLIKIKNRLKSRTPFIVLQTLVLKNNEHQLNEIKEYGRSIGVDKIEFKSAQFYNFENGNPLLPKQKKHSRYVQQQNGTYTIKNKLHNKCFRMWSGGVITWDGYLIPCCFDKDAKYTFGNLKDHSLKNIFKNKIYNEFRKTILTNRKTIDICRNCTE